MGVKQNTYFKKVDINRTDNETNFQNLFHFQMLSTKMFMLNLKTKMRLESTAYLMLKVKMKSQSQVLLK